MAPVIRHALKVCTGVFAIAVNSTTTPLGVGDFSSAECSDGSLKGMWGQALFNPQLSTGDAFAPASSAHLRWSVIKA